MQFASAILYSLLIVVAFACAFVCEKVYCRNKSDYKTDNDKYAKHSFTHIGESSLESVYTEIIKYIHNIYPFCYIIKKVSIKPPAITDAI